MRKPPQGLIDLIQTDAPISPGNSGGAVVNPDSKIVGLSEAYLPPPPSSGAVAIGFVTPAATVTDVADQLLDHGAARHVFLGNQPADIAAQVADQFDLTTTSGALVFAVTPGGPAASAGTRAGDVITKIGSDAVSNATDPARRPPQAATRHEGRVDPPQRRGHDSRQRGVDQPTAQAITRVGTWVSKSGEVAPFELFVDHVSEDGHRLSDRGSLLRRHDSQSPRDNVAAVCCHRRNKLRSRRSQGELHVATVSRGSSTEQQPSLHKTLTEAARVGDMHIKRLRNRRHVQTTRSRREHKDPELRQGHTVTRLSDRLSRDTGKNA